MPRHKHGGEEDFKRVSVLLEDEQVDLLKELAAEYRKKLGKGWSFSAVVRVAVGDFLTKMGKMS